MTIAEGNLESLYGVMLLRHITVVHMIKAYNNLRGICFRWCWNFRLDFNFLLLPCMKQNKEFYKEFEKGKEALHIQYLTPPTHTHCTYTPPHPPSTRMIHQYVTRSLKTCQSHHNSCHDMGTMNLPQISKLNFWPFF